MSADLVINRLPLAVSQAIHKRNRRLALLYYFDHQTDPVYGWTGAGLLSYNGQSWKGFGPLVDVDGLGGSRKTQTRQITVTLAGVTPEDLRFVNSKVRGRIGQLWLAALMKDRRAVDGEPYSLGLARADSQDHKIDDTRRAGVELSFYQPIQRLDRTPADAWTPEWLKAAYGDDIVGLDDLPNVSVEANWQPTET